MLQIGYVEDFRKQIVWIYKEQSAFFGKFCDPSYWFCRLYKMFLYFLHFFLSFEKVFTNLNVYREYSPHEILHRPDLSPKPDLSPLFFVVKMWQIGGCTVFDLIIWNHTILLWATDFRLKQILKRIRKDQISISSKSFKSIRPDSYLKLNFTMV